MTDFTRILEEMERGDPKAAGQLLPLVYAELRNLAAQKLAHEAPGQTLQPTALVHEAYMRLVAGETPQQWGGRAHFFAAAAEAMRRILIENVRRKRRIKHGGQLKRVPLVDSDIAEDATDSRMLAVDEAIDRLAREQEQVANVVKLRFFVGLTIEETAEALGISVRTANRDWAFGRAWLFQQLGED